MSPVYRNDDPPEEHWSDQHCYRCGCDLADDWDEDQEPWLDQGLCSEICWVENEARTVALRLTGSTKTMVLLKKVLEFGVSHSSRKRSRLEIAKQIDTAAAQALRLKFLVNRLTDHRLSVERGDQS